MRIFILRHGQAEPYKVNDASRHLTAKGSLDTREVLTRALSNLTAVDVIWASPLVRAQQTASIAAELLGKTIHTTSHLEPEANPGELLSWLNTLNQEQILLVSHLPLVGLVANHLCGFDENSIQFGTSSLVAINCDLLEKGMGDLLWELHL